MFKLARKCCPAFQRSTRNYRSSAVVKSLALASSAVASAGLKREASGSVVQLDPYECFKCSCLLNVNAATSLLTTAVFSIEELAGRYQTVLTRLTGVLEECIMLDGWNDELWDSVIALRSEANELKEEYAKVTGYMATVDKVVSAAIEASFALNANYPCTALCQQSSTAEQQLMKIDSTVKECEEKYLLVLTAIAKYKTPNEKDSQTANSEDA